MSRNYTHRAPSLEILESRIAPAAVTLNFFDQNNNAVKVVSTKGTLAQLEAAVGVASGGTAPGPLTFDFGNAPAVFRGADITVTAGATDADSIFTRVGIFDAEGVDLGRIRIDGQLDVILAGDDVSTTTAIRSLFVNSWGNGEAFDSVVIGAIGSLEVKGDFNGAYLFVGGSDSRNPEPPAHKTDIHGRIGSLTIGGSIIGTPRKDGGHIFATGDIPTVTIGGAVRGFEGTSGPTVRVAANESFNGRVFSGGFINSLTVGTPGVLGGGIFGGDGAFSGQVVGVAGVKTLTVNGSIVGGGGLESGSVGTAAALSSITVNGSLVGGGGDRSGALLSISRIGDVNVQESIIGGAGVNSGAIGAESDIGSVTIGGDIRGGTGASSGQVVSKTRIRSVTVDNVIGGSNFESGAIGSLLGIGSVLLSGDLVAGSGVRSGLISTLPLTFDEGPSLDRNAPIGSVTIRGSVKGDGSDSLSNTSAGSIQASGRIGTVVIGGSLLGGDARSTGEVFADSITSVTIGGAIVGGGGDSSGVVFANGSLGTVTIGDPAFRGSGEGGFFGSGIQGGFGVQSGAVVAQQISKIDVFGELRGDSGTRSGTIETTGTGANGRMGSVYIRGGVVGGDFVFDEFGPENSPAAIGDGVRSGSIISSASITRVLIGTPGQDIGDLAGGTASESGLIIATGDIGAVTITGSLIGGFGTRSGSIAAQGKIGPVSINEDVVGGGGENTATIVSGGTMGAVVIGTPGGFGSIFGSNGNFSAAIESGGRLTSVTLFGNLTGGAGTSTATIKTTGSGANGDMGPIFVRGNVAGGAGPGSGSIVSSGKIASVTIGDPKDSDTELGNLIGDIGTFGGSITSGGDLGPVRIKSSIIGGAANETGKISSRGRIASLTVGTAAFGGDIVGGIGNYDTTNENSFPEIGQVFARGAIGAVTVFGSVSGNPLAEDGGRWAAVIRGQSIASATIRDVISGGAGANSGGLYAVGDIGSVTANAVLGGSGFQSGFIAAFEDIGSVVISSQLRNGTGSDSGFIAADRTLGTVKVGTLEGSEGNSVRISAGDRIDLVDVAENSFFADILAGYGVFKSPLNASAQIGTVKIGTGESDGESSIGRVRGTNIVAGFSPGTDGLFGNFGDSLIVGGSRTTSTVSRIASVVVTGSIQNGPVGYGTFGILASHIVSLKVGSSNLLLTRGAQNDAYRPAALGSDTFYGELPPFD